MKKIVLTLCLVVMSVVLLAGGSHALMLNPAKPILMIDGIGDDNNMSMEIAVVVGTTPYQFGYFLNHGVIFNPLFNMNLLTFNNGDIVDFAFYNPADTYYSLSGDAGNDTYSVSMYLSGDIDAALADDQGLIASYGMTQYYKNITFIWLLPNDIKASSISFAMNDINDGMNPVPEPGTVMLLGFGLTGAAFYIRRKR